MNPKKSPTLETLLDRLEAGESVVSIEKDLGAEATEYLDVIEFLQAQRLDIKPNPENLKQGLLQAQLLEAQNSNDEWGSFSWILKSWKPFVGVAMSVLGVAVLMGYPIASIIAPNSEVTTVASRQADQAMKAVPMMAESALMADFSEESVLDEEALLLEQWEAEFASEMEDFNRTKETLEPLYNEPLFSALNSNQS